MLKKALQFFGYILLYVLLNVAIYLTMQLILKYK